jgi:hypothetical protein
MEVENQEGQGPLWAVASLMMMNEKASLNKLQINK